MKNTYLCLIRRLVCHELQRIHQKAETEGRGSNKGLQVTATRQMCDLSMNLAVLALAR